MAPSFFFKTLCLFLMSTLSIANSGGFEAKFAKKFAHQRPQFPSRKMTAQVLYTLLSTCHVLRSYNPEKQNTFASTTPAIARVQALVQATSSTNPAVHSSPRYSITRRHSLYGVEDRVVIDPGSRIWKVGFSGEGKPRDVFYGAGDSAKAFWKFTRASDPADRVEDKLLDAR